MLQKINIQPGINKQVTATGGEGQWVDGDYVRFRYGSPEKIGGWEQLSNLYKHLLKYSKINNKRQLMKRTQQYHDLIHTTLPRHNAKK